MGCLDMRMMKMKINNNGDDLFLNRLFSYLRTRLPISLQNINPIRGHVFLLQSLEGEFILKGFTSLKKMELQKNFTAHIKRAGFPNTYSFLHKELNAPLYFDNIYYAIIEYIPASEHPFTYFNEVDRMDGLALLQKFHETTKTIRESYTKEIRTEHYLIRMKKRVATFRKNIPVIRFFIHAGIVEDLMKWARWSLAGLEKEHSLFKNEESWAILHGDVAHHNFLHTENGELYLIDFDLMSIGSSSIDHLQYANRILPYLNWSLEELGKYDFPFLQREGFLYGLALPTDILREWNRIIRKRQYHDPHKVRPVVELTVGQFVERKNFFEEIKKALK